MSAGEELWSAIIRYDRRAGDTLRVRVPCSSPERARWLCGKIGGHVEKGAVVATGRSVAGLLRALGQDPGLVEKTLLYRYASGEERRRLLDEIFEVVRPTIEILDEIRTKAQEY